MTRSIDVVILAACCAKGFVPWCNLKPLLMARGIESTHRLVQRTSDLDGYNDLVLRHNLPVNGNAVLIINDTIIVPCIQLLDPDGLALWAATLDGMIKQEEPNDIDI